MVDGLFVGVLVFMVGLAIGGGAVWAMERWHDAERQMPYQALGKLQQEVDRQQIPLEEM